MPAKKPLASDAEDILQEAALRAFRTYLNNAVGVSDATMAEPG
jgi:hypothetical protein